MKRKLYGNSISPACEYCATGRLSADGKAVLCDKKGVMPLYQHCRRYAYDPLKRIPHRAPVLKAYSDDEFRIDS